MTTRTTPTASTSPPHPIHAALAPFPAVCFTLALATDVAYWRTANLMWSNFSSWLLFAGLATGVAAAFHWPGWWEDWFTLEVRWVFLSCFAAYGGGV